MKKYIYRLSEILGMIFFTLMFVIDFFPELGLNMNISIIGIIISIILAVITRQKGEPVFKSSKQELYFTIFSGIYIFSLLYILSLLGGDSQVGIELTSPILWALYLFGIITSYRKYRRNYSSQ